jgi:hypothetical protein
MVFESVILGIVEDTLFTPVLRGGEGFDLSAVRRAIVSSFLHHSEISMNDHQRGMALLNGRKRLRNRNGFHQSMSHAVSGKLEIKLWRWISSMKMADASSPESTSQSARVDSVLLMDGRRRNRRLNPDAN